jgi:hypothetical protein
MAPVDTRWLATLVVAMLPDPAAVTSRTMAAVAAPDTVVATAAATVDRYMIAAPATVTAMDMAQATVAAAATVCPLSAD